MRAKFSATIDSEVAFAEASGHVDYERISTTGDDCKNALTRIQISMPDFRECNITVHDNVANVHHGVSKVIEIEIRGASEREALAKVLHGLSEAILNPRRHLPYHLSEEMEGCVWITPLLK